MIDLFSCPEDGLIFFKKLRQLTVPSIFLLVGIFIEGLHTWGVGEGWERGGRGVGGGELLQSG